MHKQGYIQGARWKVRKGGDRLEQLEKELEPDGSGNGPELPCHIFLTINPAPFLRVTALIRVQGHSSQLREWRSQAMQ